MIAPVERSTPVQFELSRNAENGSSPSIGAPAANAGPGLHRLAIAAAVCTLALVFLGGTVTSNNAGMAVPDWPTTFGHNMFLYPPSEWVGGVFFEHTHRLLGAMVGLVMIALALWTQWREPRRWVRALAWIMLAAVIVQGVMGGLRVTEKSIFLAIVHGCFAQLFFCSTVCMVLFTSQSWMRVQPEDGPATRGLARLCVGTSLIVFCQMIVGGAYRHLGSGLAYHVTGAVIVTIMLMWVLMWVSSRYGRHRLLLHLVQMLAGMFVLQLLLGVGAYVTTINPDAPRPATLLEWLVPSAHVAVGACILAVTVTLTATVYRVLGRSEADARIACPTEVPAV